MTRRLAFLLALLTTLVGCNPPAPGSGYFPLEHGHRWTYDVKTEWENNTVDHETQVMRTLGRDDFEERPAWRRRSETGVDYWLRQDDTGIYRVAAKTDLDEAPKRDPQHRYVLKAPLAVGTQWQAHTTAYLLMRRQEFPREIRHTRPPVLMNYSIEAVGQKVDTRVGRFDDCLQVKGVAAMRLFADPVAGWRDLPLITHEWYCRGVGLVRLVREEPAGSTFLMGGTLTMELVAWQ